MSGPTHNEIQNLLGAFALHAVSTDEAALVEEHLRGCPSCAEEVAGHQEVAAALAHSYEAPPDGLWSRILDGLDGDPAEREVVMPDELSRVLELNDRRASPDHGKAAHTSNRDLKDRASSRRWPIFAAAAALVVAVLGGVALDQRSRIDELENVAAPSIDEVADAAASEPDSRTVELVGGDGVRVEVVIATNGNSYLLGNALPTLADDRTYQLWGINGAQIISLGVFGPEPGVAAFTMPSGTGTLAVTNEKAGGVVQSSQDPIAAGAVAG